MTDRQRQVLKTWMESGCCDKESAFRLGVSPKTIEYHIAAVREKLHIESREYLAVWCDRRALAAIALRGTPPRC
jgi:DNA-binding CsgD family transcriptional regulator